MRATNEFQTQEVTRVLRPVGWDHDLRGVFSGRAQRELPRYNGHELREFTEGNEGSEGTNPRRKLGYLCCLLFEIRGQGAAARRG